MKDDFRRAGVIGWPVAHSKSPALHGYWLEKYGISGSYEALAIPQNKLQSGLRRLAKAGFRGVNLTIPHKEAALVLADSVTDRAAMIGAANTMFFHPDGTIGVDNTDAYGFIRNIRQHAPTWDAKRGPALVLGAGGASRAVVYALLEAGAPSVRLANRTRIRAEMLADHFGARVEVVDWNRASDAMDGALTIVNTTSLGMVGQPELHVRFDAAPASALVTDIVYAPLVTPFLERALVHGLTIVDGLGMLLHQAVPGFEIWFGETPEVDAGLRAAVLAG